MSEPTEPTGTALQLPVRVQEKSDGLMVQWERSADAIATSIDTSKPAGKLSYLRALTAACKPMGNSLGQPLPVQDWLMHEVEVVNPQDSEVKPLLRLVLILADGSLFSTCSGVLADNWRHVVKMFGGTTFNPPLKITVQAVKSRSVGSYYQIAAVEWEASIETTARGKKTDGVK